MCAYVRNKTGLFVNTEVFREPALHFKKYGRYTDSLPNTHDWEIFWNLEEDRCKNGHEVLGVKITGDHYFYLNYCPIKLTLLDHNEKFIKNRKGKKTLNFPDFWDGDFEYYWVRDIAWNGITQKEYDKLQLNCKIKDLNGGHHLCIGKSRRKGFSYKNASLAAKQYTFERNSLCILGAVTKQYLYPKGIMSLAVSYCDFINEHTDFGKRRLINKQDHIKSGFIKMINGMEIESGYKSEIIALTFKDNPDAIRGKDGQLIIMEEAGAWSGMKDAYNVIKPTVQDGSLITGQIIVFGCVCAGTKIWTNEGNYINIEDLQQKNGIIGYGGKGVIKQPIIWMKPPAKKQCYRIETSKHNFIECSEDHPLLSSRNRDNSNNRKVIKFKRADELKIGEQLMMVRQVPIFGTSKMWKPRLVGLLIGDGYYGKKSTPQLSIEGNELYEWLKKECDNKISVYKEFQTKANTTYRSIGILESSEHLKYINIYGQTWENKHLPENINECDLYSICELLGGYYDADGSVYYNKRKNVLRVALTSKHIHLLEEVKILLYKLGIGCSITKEYRKSGFKPGVVYRLYINKIQDIIEFKKHITLISKHKQDAIDDYVTEAKNRYVYNNCLFKSHPSNTKGTYYLQEGNNQLDNLESCYITNIIDIGQQEVYNLNADITHTYISNGFVSGNTGGDMEGGSVDFNDMFYNPEPYNLLAFENIWDDNCSNTNCSYFFPAYQNYVGFMDSNGNSDKEGAKDFLYAERASMAKTLKDKKALIKHITEWAMKPSESFSISTDNIFDTELLQSQLNFLNTTKDGDALGTSGTLDFLEDKLTFVPNNKLVPADFPVKDSSKAEGCIVIWEHPIDNPGYANYIAGNDPYDQDKASNSLSLGSTIIMRRGSGIGDNHDKIVAEYTGRPNTAEEYYENVRKLLMYYNATCLYENEKTGIKSYFERKNCLHLLAYTPTILKSNSNTTVSRVYGQHMTSSVKEELEIYLRDWIIKSVGDGKQNCNFIYSKPIVKELLFYNSTGNFDRIIAFMLVIAYSMQCHRIIIQAKKEKVIDSFFTRKLFKN